MSRREGLLAAATLATVVLGAALWTVGAFAAPAPPVWRALVTATAAASCALAAAGALLRPGPGLRRSARRLALAGGVGGAAAVAAFLAALFWVPEGSVPVARRSDRRPADPGRLRLVDLNVLHGYPGFAGQEARTRRLTAALAALDPDVVVLQEAWDAAGHGRLVDRLAADLDLDAAYARANGARRLIGFEEGSAVLSRWPIREARRLRLAPRKPWVECRIALVVTLEIGGEPWTVVGAHLATSPPVADAQAADLAQRLPAIDRLLAVAGDLNVGSDSDGVAALTVRGLVDVLPGGIDHVLVPAAGPWRVERAAWTLQPADLAELTGDGTPISDHPAIVVDLVRGAAVGGGQAGGTSPSSE